MGRCIKQKTVISYSKVIGVNVERVEVADGYSTTVAEVEEGQFGPNFEDQGRMTADILSAVQEI